MSVDKGKDDVATRFASAVAALTPETTRLIGLAVSGGGDSIALMHLAARLLGPERLRVITVDHGLRADAKDEVALVASQAAELGIPHFTAHWVWDGAGNLQAAARAGRWAAIRDWAKAEEVQTVWVGHTEDDQVETLLMRLARGSGVDGLAAMRRSVTRDGLMLLRPLMDISRAELRAWLQRKAIAWCDDPSNDDTRFDRVRARQMQAQLEDIGLTRQRLLQTVDHMQAAQVSLRQAAQRFAATHVRQEAGDLIFSAEALDLRAEDTPRRVLAAAFAWMRGGTYRPRYAQLRDAAAGVAIGETVTLNGCILTPEKPGGARMTREASATKVQRVAQSTTKFIWDERWIIEGPAQAGTDVRALGEGIKDCPDWRETTLPRRSLLATPAIWQNGTMIAAPVAGFTEGWSARIVADFHSSAFAIED